MDKQQYWFPAKRYGWGWGPPRTWQGWLVLIVWLMLFFGGVALFGVRGHLLAVVLFVTVMTLALVLICWWKGAPPRWRWGEPD